MSGPPTVASQSKTSLTLFGTRRPAVFSSSVKFELANPSVAPLPKNEPDNLLPPSLKTRLTVTPAVTDSPSPPVDVVTTTSSLAPVLGTHMLRPPFDWASAILTPLTVTRE